MNTKNLVDLNQAITDDIEEASMGQMDYDTDQKEPEEACICQREIRDFEGNIMTVEDFINDKIALGTCDD
jgi:hypothetical protein